MVSSSFAQTPRQPTSSEGKTGFTNIAVRGLNLTGVPAYFEMTAGDGDVFYLYVGSDGKLRIASEGLVGTGASPSIVAWEDASGTVVGDQSDLVGG